MKANFSLLLTIAVFTRQSIQNNLTADASPIRYQTSQQYQQPSRTQFFQSTTSSYKGIPQVIPNYSNVYQNTISEEDIQKALKRGPSFVQGGQEDQGVLEAQIQSLKELLGRKGYTYSASSASGSTTSSTETTTTTSLKKCEENLAKIQKENQTLAKKIESKPAEKPSQNNAEFEQKIQALQSQLSALQKELENSNNEKQQLAQQLQSAQENIAKCESSKQEAQSSSQDNQCASQLSACQAQSVKNQEETQNQMAQLEEQTKSARQECQVSLSEAKAQVE